jgi:transposase
MAPRFSRTSAVSKRADHTPIYRIEKAFARQGIPVARSTMNELIHRASAILAAGLTRLLNVVRMRPIVAADETRLRRVRDKSGSPGTVPHAWLAATRSPRQNSRERRRSLDDAG